MHKVECAMKDPVNCSYSIPSQDILTLWTLFPRHTKNGPPDMEPTRQQLLPPRAALGLTLQIRQTNRLFKLFRRDIMFRTTQNLLRTMKLKISGRGWLTESFARGLAQQ